MGPNANTNANAENESVPVPIDANANAIELTKNVDIPSEILNKKIYLPFAFAFAYRIPRVGNLRFPL